MSRYIEKFRNVYTKFRLAFESYSNKSLFKRKNYCILKHKTGKFIKHLLRISFSVMKPKKLFIYKYFLLYYLEYLCEKFIPLSIRKICRKRADE